ncbi:MFS transporter [Streptomyces sp. MI02-7b]|uniref:MFS transporter n=1 Tax=Streptomyces sp. MI02-7b TaxID=462941 RepID=UPI0029ADD5AF|nr:MFS transporter [Streptomyces sp. MI02-7b]MDX3075815.1 MFS transporter [Streptomyces sp. MI02-7b]
MAVTDAPVAPTRPSTSAPTARTVVWTLIGASLVVKAAGFAWDYLSYYVAAGHGTTAAGGALTLFGVGWCLGQGISGWLTDRAGQRTALAVMMTFAAAACVALTLAHSLPALLVVSVCLGLTMETYRPAVSAAINEHLLSGAARTRAQTALYWSINVGIAVCGGLGGYVAHHYGYRPLFLANAAVCAAFALLALRLLSADRPTGARENITYRQVLADAALRWTATVSVAAMVCAWGLVSVLPLLMTDDGLPPTAYGTAMIANTVAVLALTPAMTRLLVGRGDTLRLSPVTVLAAGTAILGLGLAYASFQHTVLGYSMACAVLVPGEICYSVAVGAYVSTAVPDGAVGRYQAVLSAASAAASLPPLGIALALHAGGRPLVASILGGCAVLGVLACYPLSRALRRTGHHH